jgi:hypothetical protein
MEDKNRRAALKQLIKKRKINEEQCRWLGDAIFAFFALRMRSSSPRMSATTSLWHKQ